MAEYAVEFGMLLAEAGWNEPTLRNAFSRELTDHVRDALASGARPEDLHELLDRAIEIDNYQREQHREWSSRPNPPWSPVHRRYSPHRVPPSSPSAEPRSHDEEPIQLGCTWLSNSDRCRRLSSGACLYCSQEGHYVAGCSL